MRITINTIITHIVQNSTSLILWGTDSKTYEITFIPFEKKQLFSVADGFTSQNNTKNISNIQVYVNEFLGTYALQIEIGGQKLFIVIDTLAPTFWVQGDKCIDTEVGLFPGSGAIGMGRNSSQGYPISNSTPSPILALYQQKAISNNLFSLYLGRIPDPFREPNATIEQSLLTLGRIDTTLYTGDINYFSVKDKDNWEIDLDDVIVNGKKLGIKRTIILDTGSPNIFMPPKDSSTINKLIPDLGSGYFTSDPCMSSIYAGEGTTWYLGGTFFRSIYAVFDYENSRVGLAHAAPRKS
ncbi:putative aspartic-type endopeptidase CtsD [Gigaspora margarita]|uniref:Putative aspartic-type endopeptidase CtsD n=1 Tax=Gigaspora margarita TaxID=4874 RepID=A0A8H4APM2_GIGMA|nr:putative aspartic-type endopeptidase CtsD [Gigaspora margarita]